jgi:fructose-specific phosphotransferase system IIC component
VLNNLRPHGDSEAAGFLGGLIGGIIAGYIALFLETYMKVPKWAEALMPMMIIPTITAIVAGLIMVFLLGGPIAALTGGLTAFIKGLDQSQKLAYGFILGFIGCIDYGGAISKVPNLICNGLLADGIMEPEGIKVLAAMVPPFGVSLAYLISKAVHKPIYYKEEIENIKVAFPMGLCMISKGVIPIAMNDLVRTVICTATGCGVCGAISRGELGTIGNTGVTIEGGMTEVKYTDPQDAKTFVERTGVDTLAVAIGTCRGLYPKGVTPKLRMDVLEDIKKVVDIPLVLHGGSGNPDSEVAEAVRIGIQKVNISSDYKSAFFTKAREILAQPNSGWDPNNLFPECIEAGKQVIKHKMELFDSKDKAALYRESGVKQWRQDQE